MTTFMTCIECLFLLAAQNECGAGLSCFKCSDISKATDCDDVVQCGASQSCYIRRTHTSSAVAYILGCQDNERCPSSQSFSLVGRNTELRDTQECFECCSTNGCNKHICEMPTDQFGDTSNAGCFDRLVECSALNALENMCGNISLAKTMCRRFCGLCNLVDGGWSTWSSWSLCSTSCGLGFESRNRTCSNPYPANGGEPCPGNVIMHTSCFQRTCPDHGGWSVWEAWGKCSSRCGSGLMKRYRRCDNPPPSLYGHYCIGDPDEYQLCNGMNCGVSTSSPPSKATPSTTCSDTLDNCAAIESAVGICAEVEKAKNICKLFCGLCSIVDGGWSDWTEWSSCTVTCDNGTRTRTRDCTNPAPEHGGKLCVGVSKETFDCYLYKCPVHGGWSLWSSWNPCSVTCGMGLTHRRRTCDNPTPSHDGNMCFGDPVEYNLCSKSMCAVNGGWTLWTPWSSCSDSCGQGIRHRTRTCANPVPTPGGLYCDGDPTEYAICEIRSCEVNGGWTLWTSWSTCFSSTNCGWGMQNMTRACANPRPANGGMYCDGNSISYRECWSNLPCLARVESGRLEVSYNGVWGTVCDDHFTETEARVACRMMGISGSVSVLGSDTVTDGTGPIWLDDVYCNGTEPTLFDCSYNGHTVGAHNCQHNEDIGLKCN